MVHLVALCEAALIVVPPFTQGLRFFLTLFRQYFLCWEYLSSFLLVGITEIGKKKKKLVFYLVCPLLIDVLFHGL